jgi:uncharacterized SAM-binding protein YcdF (DUF218 family)
VSYFEPALPFLLLLGLWNIARTRHKGLLTKSSLPEMISTIGILLLSLNAAAWLLSRPLEIWYSEDPEPHGTADAIVVLGGYVSPPLPNRPYSLAGQDTYSRLQHAIWLFKNWRPLPILASAGGPEGEWYAKTMRHILEAEGIPPDLIWIESRARSTRENAVYGSEILKAHGISHIALVVDASSMPRAAASFEKLGIMVAPAPAQYTSLTHTANDFLPGWRAVASNGETIHELAGLAWYWMRGWI